MAEETDDEREKRELRKAQEGDVANQQAVQKKYEGSLGLLLIIHQR
jgi:hypothetical protein